MREENRHYRRKVKQRFDDIDNCEDAINDIRLGKCKKSHLDIKTVRERVQTQLDQRYIRHAQSYLKQTYNSELHRQYFINFFSLLIESDSVHAQRLALELRDWLYPSSADYGYKYKKWYYKWLQDFFKDEPEWEFRLQEWINSIWHAK